MVARMTWSVTSLYLPTSSCRAYSPSPLVPPSSSCLSTRSEAGFSVSRHIIAESSFALLHPVRNAGEIPVLVVFSVGRGFPLIRLAMSRRVTPSTTASLLCQSPKSRGVRSSNFLSPLMALVKLPLSFVKPPIIGSTRKAVLCYTTAVSDAIQRSLSSCSGIPVIFQFAVCMIQQYCCTLMIPRQYVKDTPVNNARTPGKLFLNECVWFDSPVDWGPKIFVDVRVTTNLHRKYFPRVLDDRGSHELVTKNQIYVSRQQCAVGSCFSTASARVSRG